MAHQEIYRVAAYADLIDINVLLLKDQTDGIEVSMQKMETKIDSLQQSCEALKSTVQQLVSFLGVVVPAWMTLKEVENGDEMGIVRPSAVELELNIVFEFDRQVPGFSHEDVVSIRPPAGTLVKKGSTVTVVINLEG